MWAARGEAEEVNLFGGEAAHQNNQEDSGGEAGDLAGYARPFALLLQLGEEVGCGDVEEAAGAQGEQEGDVLGAGGAGGGYGEDSEERGQTGEHGHAERTARGELEVDEDGEVAHAVGNLVERDGECGHPADAWAGEEGGGDGSAIHEAVQHAGEDEAEGPCAVCVVMVVVLVGGDDLRLGVGSGEGEEEALDAEEDEHAGERKRPGERAVAEAGDGLRHEMEEGGGEEDTDGEADDEGEEAVEEGLLRAQAPSGGDGQKLDGDGGSERGEYEGHGSMIMQTRSQLPARDA